MSWTDGPASEPGTDGRAPAGSRTDVSRPRPPTATAEHPLARVSRAQLTRRPRSHVRLLRALVGMSTGRNSSPVDDRWRGVVRRPRILSTTDVWLTAARFLGDTAPRLRVVLVAHARVGHSGLPRLPVLTAPLARRAAVRAGCGPTTRARLWSTGLAAVTTRNLRVLRVTPPPTRPPRPRSSVRAFAPSVPPSEDGARSGRLRFRARTRARSSDR